MSENGVASAQDFRRAAEARKGELEDVERVVLPKSRYAVLLRRPTPMWFLFRGRLPMSLAARSALQAAPTADGRGDTVATGTIQTPEEFIEFSKWIVDLMREVFVSPRLSLHPSAEEISPEWLAEEDVNFVLRWAVGEVVSTGDGGRSGGDTETNPRRSTPDPRYCDLAEFRPRPGPPDAGTGSGGVRMPPEPVAQADGNGSSD